MIDRSVVIVLESRENILGSFRKRHGVFEPKRVNTGTTRCLGFVVIRVDVGNVGSQSEGEFLNRLRDLTH